MRKLDNGMRLQSIHTPNHVALVVGCKMVCIHIFMTANVHKLTLAHDRG